MTNQNNATERDVRALGEGAEHPEPSCEWCHPVVRMSDMNHLEKENLLGLLVSEVSTRCTPEVAGAEQLAS